MGEKYGPLTYKQSLEEDFKQIAPKCQCTESRIARARAASSVADGSYSQDQAEAGLHNILDECPTSKAVAVCCDLVHKCTQIEFIDMGLLKITKIVDTAIANASAPGQETVYE